MPRKRIVIAAAALLAAVYLRAAMPDAAEELFAGTRAVLDEEQAVVVIPERISAWLDLG